MDLDHYTTVSYNREMRFIEFDGFSHDWRSLRLGDEDLRELENHIIANPKAAPVVSGTGGIRKLRFSPSSWRRGKSGAIRVLYAVFEQHCVVILAGAYAKAEQADIPAGERKALRILLAEIAKMLEKRP